MQEGRTRCLQQGALVTECWHTEEPSVLSRVSPQGHVDPEPQHVTLLGNRVFGDVTS